MGRNLAIEASLMEHSKVLLPIAENVHRQQKVKTTTMEMATAMPTPKLQ